MPQAARIAAILNLLGPDATERDARCIEPVLAQAFPGVPIAGLPPETFAWLRDGSGRAPVVVVVPASATSLLGIYADMTDTKRAQLMAMATAISMDSST